MPQSQTLKKSINLEERICLSPNERLTALKAQLVDRDSLIRLIGFFKLTKTEQGWVDALAVRDPALETSVDCWMEERSSFEAILDRYQEYDAQLHSRERPKHYALRILSGIGSIASGKNIFMFFPDALNLKAEHEEQVFGLEFVDVWSNLFRRSIFNCVKRIFAIEDQLKILVPLETNLERTIFLSSVFHEIGHRVGPFKVSPGTAPGMNLSEFQTDVFGELSTDALLVLNLSEFPEVALFIILQRLFWFGRRGFADNPLCGQTNSDNDAWIGAFLWSRLITHGVLVESAQGLRYQPENVKACFQIIVDQIDSLAKRSLGKDQQQEMIWQWMSDQVPFSRGQFFLPEGLKKCFGNCDDIAEVPHFQPLFPYSQLAALKGELT